MMRFLLALFIPWFLFFTIKRPISGIICLALQLTLIGWIPATLWAIFSLSNFKGDKKLAAMEKRMQARNAAPEPVDGDAHTENGPETSRSRSD